ncbi:unnamed protein product [Pleuronectes platessa]|uniref:Uncharacterized protein n=1 Tax=Pleuronectes platessa TaxID=8262 RepID=A0A9N7Z9K5_PLEPL|nr:unnamed protein product [Pleuronectes platessa]
MFVQHGFSCVSGFRGGSRLSPESQQTPDRSRNPPWNQGGNRDVYRRWFSTRLLSSSRRLPQTCSSLRGGNQQVVWIGGEMEEAWRRARARPRWQRQSALSLLCEASAKKTSLLVSVGDGCVWLVSREQLGDLGASATLCGTAARHSGKAAPVKRTADSFPCSCYTAVRDPAH